MKYKVIGWTDYDNTKIESESPSWAAIHAIMDEIKEKGFVITGHQHQEGYNCVPVLNDGIKRTMSQRGWGRLMADALGYRGLYDYSLFTYNPNSDSSKLPKAEDEFRGPGHCHHYTQEELDEMLKNIDQLLADIDKRIESGEFGAADDEAEGEELEFDEEYCEFVDDKEEEVKYDIKKKSQLAETITVKADRETAERAVEKGVVTLPELPELWLIDERDTLVLDTEGGKYRFRVSSVSRERDFTEEEANLVDRARYAGDPELTKKSRELFATKPDRVIIGVKPLKR